MDRRRAGSPVYTRQWSNESRGSNSTGSSSPAPMSPAHPNSRLSSNMSTIKRTQNVAAKAAAQRLAQVMASSQTADDDEEDDLDFRFPARPAPVPASSGFSSVNHRGSSNGVSVTRPNRSPSPAVGTLWRMCHQFGLHRLEGHRCQFVQLQWCHQANNH